MEYGVQTHNKFAFLNDDVDVSDPEEALAKKMEEVKKADVSDHEALTKKAEEAKKAVIKEKREKALLVDPSVADKRSGGGSGGGASNFDNRTGVPRGGEHPRGGGNRGGPRGGEKRSGGGTGVTYSAGDRTGGTYSAGDRTGGGPRGERPRGGGNRGGPRGGGGGPRNNYGGGGGAASGLSKPVLKDESEPENKPKETENVSGWDSNVGWDNEEVTAIEPPKVEENVENKPVEETKEPEVEAEQVPREKTYEEWKSEQQQKIAEQIHFNTRKPGEGDDQKIYKKLIPMKSPNTNGPKHENESDESTQHKEKREKALLIDLSFADKRSGGGSGGGYSGFGDRSGGPRGERPRGGGNRGGPRGGGGGPRNNYGGGGAAGGPSKRQQGGSFMLENEQFPALGAAH